MFDTALLSITNRSSDVWGKIVGDGFESTSAFKSYCFFYQREIS